MDLEKQLQNNYDRIRNRYDSFVSSICEHLINKRVPVGELRTFLGRLPALEGNEDFKALLKKANMINAVIDLIGDKFPSFLQYSIFQSILDEYCSDAEKCCDVLKYSEYLNAFIDQHTVHNFMLMNPTLVKLTTDSEKLHLKKIDIVKTTKVAKAVVFERFIADTLYIRQSMLNLYKIEYINGYVTLTYLIPKAVAKKFFFADAKLNQKQIEKLQ